MWAVGYAGRLPAVLLPSPLLLSLLMATLFLGGLVLGRRTGLGFLGGAAVGALCALLNLLVLGSFLMDGSRGVTPSALWWIPGSLLVSALLAAVGSWIGARFLIKEERRLNNWPSVFTRITGLATLLLLAVGGLVTSSESGLAVVDWPNSFGYNMFLYPFSRMTGGIYYEHAHRLFGALVGLTTLVLALFLQRVETRRWVRILGWVALALVLVQGLLGGLRVTGGLTLSTSDADMAPSLTLAMVHGVLGQAFFALLVSLAAFTSTGWTANQPSLRRRSAGTDRWLAATLVAILLTQLTLGAVQRHFHQLLLVHVLTGVALVTPLAIHVGFRAWGLNVGQLTLQRLGLALLGGIGVQVGLGLAAWAVTGADGRASSRLLDLTVTTAHQWFGAVLLAISVLLTCWSFRLLEPGEEPRGH